MPCCGEPRLDHEENAETGKSSCLIFRARYPMYALQRLNPTASYQKKSDDDVTGSLCTSVVGILPSAVRKLDFPHLVPGEIENL
jgi:hypothetical protein